MEPREAHTDVGPTGIVARLSSGAANLTHRSSARIKLITGLST